MHTDIKRNFKHIRKFLFWSINKEFLIFLFFFILSTSFWLSMTLDETYEKEIEVPIHIVNIPQNAIITTEMVDTVKATIRDKGFAFLTYMNSNRFRSINLNFSTYANQETGKGNVPLNDVQNILYQRLSGSSKITAIKPDNLFFYFNYGESKQVPVRLNGIFKPAESFYLSTIDINPQKVTVYAQKEVLDTITHIDTERLRIVDFRETITKQAKLKKTVGIKTVPNKVTLRLSPDILIEESIEVPIVAINTPSNKTVRTFPARVKVLFNVGAEMYKMINERQFKVVVDFLELSKNPSAKCTLRLQSAPSEARQARLEINQVDYVIEQNGETR